MFTFGGKIRKKNVGITIASICLDTVNEWLLTGSLDVSPCMYFASVLARSLKSVLEITFPVKPAV